MVKRPRGDEQAQPDELGNDPGQVGPESAGQSGDSQRLSSIADAADVLGVSEGTVKSRAARGRARLLPRLAHLRPAGEPAGEALSDQDRRNQAAPQRVLPAQEGGDEAP